MDIGEHVFPTSKYRIIKRRIDSDGSLDGKVEIVPPEPITDKEVLAVHTDGYINKLKSGTFTQEESVTLEVPYSSEIVEASFTCCGGTLTTARGALERKAALHLGGGFHHAFPDHGEGFCVLNDIAVSIRALQETGKVKKALVIDCDLHQGNGTAFIFQDDSSVFTFSMHQENNYPFHKPESDIDIGLEDYTRDKVYLRHLYDNIPKIINTFKPEIILYLAGADPYEKDQLGNLAVSKDGLRERDNYICTQARNFGVPLAITLAGGYAANREDTVDIHFATVEECVRVFAG
ncbi:MAG: histone deacetylase [Candidatus Omnitrophota bacterium]|nr:histone deacetylase [Candidatus Omnitrophota bacterium]